MVQRRQSAITGAGAIGFGVILPITRRGSEQALMTDEIERVLDLIEESERDWADEPAIDENGWRQLAALAKENGLPSAMALCLAAAGEWPEHRGWFGVREEFDANINAIGTRHGFVSLPEHLDLCTSLHLLVCTLPTNLKTSDNALIVERGATSWRDFRRRAPGWMSRAKRSDASFLYVLALELHGDHTCFAAASIARVRQRLTALVLKLESILASSPTGDVARERGEMNSLLESLVKIESSKGGRHSHGQRRRDCVALAKGFWVEQFGRKPTVAFVPDPITAPASAFANWFCDVMKCIDDWSVATCREVLRARSRR